MMEHQTKECKFCFKWYIKPCDEVKSRSCMNLRAAKLIANGGTLIGQPPVKAKVKAKPPRRKK